jgi:hypothetical protein
MSFAYRPGMRDALPFGEGGGYGLGLLALDFGPECGGVYEGHDGGLPGYLSMLLSTGDGERRLAVSVTIGASDPTDPEATERFWAAFNTLLLTAACGTTPTASKVTGWEREGGRPGLLYQSGYSAWMSPSNNLQ